MEKEPSGEKIKGLKTIFAPRRFEIEGVSLYKIASEQLLDPNLYITHCPDEIIIFNFTAKEAEIWIKNLYSRLFKNYKDNVALSKEGVSFEDLYRYEKKLTAPLEHYQELTLGKIIGDYTKINDRSNTDEKKRALANKTNAINLLIECNRGLIGKKVKEIKRKKQTNIYGEGDLFDEGSIGIIRAAEKFDYRRGLRFSTYVGWWIRKAVEKPVAELPERVRLPLHMGENIQKVMAIINEYSLDIYDDIDLNFLCKETQLSPEQIIELLKAPRIITFSDYTGNKGRPDESLAQRIEGDIESTESAEEEFFARRKREIITKLVDDIPDPKSRRIVTLFMQDMSYQEIGDDKLVDLTKQAVQYRLKTTFTQLREQYPELEELLTG